ncbi:unnamed protein product [Leptosia nina]|uniref:Uncharacterized protein n=1 Tax=Leptosia nina TaxID=320188 RepID=A0AAV1JXI6_9NEOP
MQAAPTRYVSASELYSRDEVELLLEEIRELEPTSCRGEEGADCEIAGSYGGGGRSPAATDLTDRSWDSHAHYSRAPPPRPLPLAPLYCRLRYLRTSMGALTLLLVICSCVVCGCVWGGVGLHGSSVTRPLLLGALTSLLAHGLLLVLHITGLSALFPLDFYKWSGWLGAWSAAWLLLGAGLALRPITDMRIPYAASVIYIAAAMGACGACAAAGMVSLALRNGCVRAGGAAPAAAASTCRPRARSRLSSGAAAYRAVPQPSTSRDDPL